MKGSPKILDSLNTLLTGELTSIDQYFIHSRLYNDWGLTKLFERLNHEMDDEKQHADALIQRILFLEGTPNLKERAPLNIGTDVPSMLANDLALEHQIIAALRNAIALCEQERDYQSREILINLLKDTEEDHTHWLEKQLSLIEKIGLPNYIQSQMG